MECHRTPVGVYQPDHISLLTFPTSINLFNTTIVTTADCIAELRTPKSHGRSTITHHGSNHPPPRNTTPSNPPERRNPPRPILSSRIPPTHTTRKPKTTHIPETGAPETSIPTNTPLNPPPSQFPKVQNHPPRHPQSRNRRLKRRRRGRKTNPRSPRFSSSGLPRETHPNNRWLQRRRRDSHSIFVEYLLHLPPPPPPLVPPQPISLARVPSPPPRRPGDPNRDVKA